jgi:hypothetical protein
MAQMVWGGLQGGLKGVSTAHSSGLSHERASSGAHPLWRLFLLLVCEIRAILLLMEHDKAKRLLDLNYKDRVLLGGKSSPLPDRMARHLLAVAQAVAREYELERGRVFMQNPYDSANGQLEPAWMRDNAAHVGQLIVELTEASDLVLQRDQPVLTR